jgi:hypothetical protein
MQKTEVRFFVPHELVRDRDIKNLSKYGYQNFVLGLYLDEEISLGKAAKLLNKSYDEFIELLGQRKLPYFRETPEEISDALSKLDMDLVSRRWYQNTSDWNTKKINKFN